jgi:spore coat protein U-like protein
MNTAMKGLGAFLILALPAGASAATATGRMNVRITIQAACEVVSSSDLDFGSVTSTGSAIDQSSTIAVKCSNATPYNLGLGLGSGGSSTTARKMSAGGAEFVSYGLYRDAARSQPWGETIGTDTATATGTGSNQNFTVYGRVNSQTTPAPGSYSDVVTVTVTY